MHVMSCVCVCRLTSVTVIHNFAIGHSHHLDETGTFGKAPDSLRSKTNTITDVSAYYTSHESP
jgi:hypothetical protein